MDSSGPEIAMVDDESGKDAKTTSMAIAAGRMIRSRSGQTWIRRCQVL